MFAGWYHRARYRFSIWLATYTPFQLGMPLSWRLKQFFNPHPQCCYDILVPDFARPRPPEERGEIGSAYELTEHAPGCPDAENVLGRVISDVSPSCGTYGMGGLGFYGIHLEDEWLIIALTGAGEWIEYDGAPALLYDFDNPDETGAISVTDRATEHLTGQTVTGFEVGKHRFHLALSNGKSLDIHPDPARRPRFVGSRRKRKFNKNDDLQRAVFLSPTDEIWG